MTAVSPTSISSWHVADCDLQMRELSSRGRSQSSLLTRRSRYGSGGQSTFISMATWRLFRRSMQGSAKCILIVRYLHASTSRLRLTLYDQTLRLIASSKGIRTLILTTWHSWTSAKRIKMLRHSESNPQVRHHSNNSLLHLK